MIICTSWSYYHMFNYKPTKQCYFTRENLWVHTMSVNIFFSYTNKPASITCIHVTVHIKRSGFAVIHGHMYCIYTTDIESLQLLNFSTISRKDGIFCKIKLFYVNRGLFSQFNKKSSIWRLKSCININHR